MQAGQGGLEDAQRQAEGAAATLIERKFKEPANLEVSQVFWLWVIGSSCAQYDLDCADRSNFNNTL